MNVKANGKLLNIKELKNLFIGAQDQMKLCVSGQLYILLNKKRFITQIPIF